MSRFSLLLLTVSVLIFSADSKAAEPPADRVVAMYFHRTERCPTCKMMGSYSEEAVKKGFPEQVQAGSVEFHFIDIQKAENAALCKAYKVTGPALIVSKVAGGKVEQFKDLQEIWTKVRDKAAFLTYVQENVKAHLK